MDEITRATTIIRIIHGGHDNIQNTAGPPTSPCRHDGPTIFTRASFVASNSQDRTKAVARIGLSHCRRPLQRTRAGVEPLAAARSTRGGGRSSPATTTRPPGANHAEEEPGHAARRAAVGVP